MGYVCHIDKVNTSHGIRKGKQTNGKFCIRAFTGVVVVYNHSNIVFRYGSKSDTNSVFCNSVAR